MAYFSSTKTPPKSPSQSPNSSNPFAFDIDEQGHSSVSKQRKIEEFDHSMINHGEHCSLSICGQLDILPCKCDYCRNTYCRTHSHTDKHHCEEYIPDLTISPNCEKCGENIKIDPKIVKNRTDYNLIIKSHLDSNCTLYTFRRSDEERAVLKASLLCKALYCNNHTSAGKKLSTLICRDCHKQVCLSHRSPDFHQCEGLVRDKARQEAEEMKKNAMKDEVMKKMYGKLGQSDDMDSTEGGNGKVLTDTEKLRNIQQSVHQNAREKCKNPFLLNREKQIEERKKAQIEKEKMEKNNNLDKNVDKNVDRKDGENLLEPQPSTVSTIPTRGTIVTHPQIELLNTKTAIIQAKTRSKNISQSQIPQTNKIFALIYFPQTIISEKEIRTKGDEITPLSTQENLLFFNQNNYNTISTTLLTEENPLNTLQHSPLLLPQCCTGGVDDSTSKTAIDKLSNLQNNPKMAAPLYVALDKTWSIKQCIDEICSCVNLVKYDPFLRSNSGKSMYTLSMLSLPIATFIPSLTLGTVIDQYQFDFDIHTEMVQEELKNVAAGNSPMMKNNTNIVKEAKSAGHRINTVFLPVHLAFGWFIDQ